MKIFTNKCHLYVCIRRRLSLPLLFSLFPLFFVLVQVYLFLFSLLHTAGSQWAALTSHLLPPQLLADDTHTLQMVDLLSVLVKKD